MQMIYRKTLKTPPKKLFRTNKFSKVERYTQSTSKNQIYFHTLKMNYTKQKLRKKSNNSIKKINYYLGINLTEEVRDRYTINSKSLMKEMKKIQINEDLSHVHGLKEYG